LVGSFSIIQLSIFLVVSSVFRRTVHAAGSGPCMRRCAILAKTAAIRTGAMNLNERLSFDFDMVDKGENDVS